MAIPKYKMKLEWKSFNVNMSTVEAWLKANAGEHYSGNRSVQSLELYFREEPSNEIKEAIQSYWSSISEESDEVISYKPNDQIKAEKASYQEELKLIKEAIVTKTWNLLKGPERKLLLGLEVERQEFVDAELLE